MMPETQQQLLDERVYGKHHRKKAEKSAIQQALDYILEGYVKEAGVCG